MYRRVVRIQKFDVLNFTAYIKKKTQDLMIRLFLRFKELHDLTDTRFLIFLIFPQRQLSKFIIFKFDGIEKFEYLDMNIFEGFVA